MVNHKAGVPRAFEWRASPNIGSGLDCSGTDRRLRRQQYHQKLGSGDAARHRWRLVGGYLLTAIGAAGITGFNLYSILVAIVGAVVVLWIYHAVSVALFDPAL